MLNISKKVQTKGLYRGTTCYTKDMPTKQSSHSKFPVNYKPTAYKLTDYGVIVGEDTRYVLRVRDLPDDQRPRERLIEYGPSNLSMAEIVSVLWGVGTKKEDVMNMAHRVLKEYGETAIMHETDPVKLAQTLNIPTAKACQLIAGFELGRRFFEKRSGRPVFVRTARQAFDHIKGISLSNKEQLRGLYLNSRHEVIHDEVISVGSLTANIVHPREVFSPAIEQGAVAIIIGHNHPSGNLTPTEADISVTKQLMKAGQILGIELLDHLIIADDAFRSVLNDISTKQDTADAN